MRILCYLCIGIFLTVLGSVDAFAESTGDMLSACKIVSESKAADGHVRIPESTSGGICWGAFSILQEVGRTLDSSGNPIMSFCLPRNSTRTQLVAVFVNYAEKHPEQWHLDFFQVATVALSEAFSCPQVRR